MKNLIQEIWQKDKHFWIFLLVIFPMMLYANYASGLETKGVARSIDQSLINSYASAHFTCNRKRLWADLDSLVVKNVTTSRYKIAGGKKSITEYNTFVAFNCTAEYKKLPNKSQQ